VKRVLKQMFVGTALGRMALSARESLQLLRAMHFQPEIAGTLANDWLATFLVTRLCQDHKTFVDVGAHIGSIISEVTRNTPTAKIVAIEAIPDKVAALRRRFPAVEFHACALSDSEGEASFFVNTKRSGYSSLGRPAVGASVDTVELKVPMKRLDNLIAADEIDVIKIDVEGAELGVLRGSEQIVAKSRPTIMFESGPPAENGLGYTKEAMWDWFSQRNYAVLVPNRVAHIDPGLSQDGFIESHLYPRRTTNYFAVATERRDEIRDRARGLLKIKVSQT
jgi:FkbM family methyltransferase